MKARTLQIKIRCYKWTCGPCECRQMPTPAGVYWCGAHRHPLFQWPNGRFQRLVKCLQAEKEAAKCHL